MSTIECKILHNNIHCKKGVIEYVQENSKDTTASYDFYKCDTPDTNYKQCNR